MGIYERSHSLQWRWQEPTQALVPRPRGVLCTILTQGWEKGSETVPHLVQSEIFLPIWVRPSWDVCDLLFIFGTWLEDVHNHASQAAFTSSLSSMRNEGWEKQVPWKVEWGALQLGLNLVKLKGTDLNRSLPLNPSVSAFNRSKVQVNRTMDALVQIRKAEKPTCTELTGAYFLCLATVETQPILSYPSREASLAATAFSSPAVRSLFPSER